MSLAPTTMQYVRLGKSGLRVSQIILGCMSYGPKGNIPWGLEEPEAIEHIKLAYELGINTFDTSGNYGNGMSERILGNAIKQLKLPRDEIVVMTKAYSVVGREPAEAGWTYSQADRDRLRYTNQYGLSRKNLFQSVKISLERLQLEYIDVLQCHRFDYDTPIEETMHALNDLVRAGLVRYIGMSSCYAWQFQKMQLYAQQNGLAQFISMQNLYNPVYREEEREMMPMLMDMGVGVIPWSPLAGGFVAKPFKLEPGEGTTRQQIDMIRAWASNIAASDPWPIKLNEKIEGIAKQRNVSMAQVSLAWALSKPFMTAPIIGNDQSSPIEGRCRCPQVEVNEEEVKGIDDFYKSQAVFGHS